MTDTPDPDRILSAAALAALPFGIWVWDPERRLAFANDAAWRLAGVDAAELPYGTPFRDVARLLAYRGAYGPGDPEAQTAQHLGLDRSQPLRRLLHRADGTCHELHSIPLPGGGFCSVAAEVTGYIAAAEEATALVRRLETVLAHLHGGLALYDAERRLVLSNPAYEDLVGLARSTVRPGMTQREVLGYLVRRGEIANAEPDEITAERRRLDRSMPCAWQRERPNGQVVRYESQPMPGGGYLMEVTDITAVKRAEDEARRRAALLDGVLASLPHGVVVFGPDQRVAMVNAAHQAIMAGAELSIGEHREEIARRRASSGEYGPGDPEALTRENLTTLTSQPVRQQRVRPNGTVIDIHYTALPDGGRVQVTTDITALHQARAEATERAALLQVMLDNMRHGIALFDAGHRLVASNALAARLMELTPERLWRGREINDIITEQGTKGEFGPITVAEVIRNAGRRDRSKPLRYTRTRPDGTVVEVISDPTPDGGFVCTYSDITARARAEAEAREQAATLQATIDNLRHGVILYGADRRVHVANVLASELTGHLPGTIRPGQTLEELVARLAEQGAMGEGPEAEAAVARILGADRSKPWHNVRETRDGRVLEVHSDPMPDGGFIVSHVDITPLARAEAAARERAATLQVMLDNTRHGIALYGPDRRLLVANTLAAGLACLRPEDMAPGRSLDEMVQTQLERGAFGTGEAAMAMAERVLRADRSRPQRKQRTMPDGRILEISSHPTPDGGFVITWSDITELAGAKAEASQRAATLQVMLDNTRHGISYFGPDRRMIATNALSAELVDHVPGLNRVGMTLDDLIQEQYRRGNLGTGKAGRATMEAALSLDRSRPSRSIRTAGSGRVIEVISDPTPDGGFVVTHTDITQLVQAQQEASQRATMLQVMLDTIRHGICYYGPDRRVIAANALASELGGHPPGSLVPGRSIDELIAEQLRIGAVGGDAQAVADAALRMDRSRPARYVRPSRDGRIVEVTSDPTPDGGFVVTMADITPLAKAEAEAQRRAGILQAMLDNLRHGIALFDAEDRVVAVNPVIRQLLDLPEEVLAPGRPYTDFVDLLQSRGEYGEGETGLAVATTIKGRDRRKTVRSVRTRPNGTVLEVVSDPISDGGWVLTYTDVTEDRHIRAELERAKEAAEAANRAKSRFLATMSHELRTPLNAVIGFSEAIMADPDPVRGQDYLRSIHEAGRHLLSLIDDILDVTRAETTGFPISEGEVDVLGLAEGSVRVMRATAASAQVTLEAVLPPALPLVRADELRLRQVLLNLLSNAVKFTPAGGVVTLAAAVEPAGDLVLRVSDTGIGIPPEEIPRAFEPFTQLDGSLSRRFPGSGLGLYLSRALAAAQGAELTLESAPGAGTTAVLRIPKSRLLAPLAA